MLGLLFIMNRRILLQMGLGTAWATPLLAAWNRQDPLDLDKAADVLARATASGQVGAAALHVRQGDFEFSKGFGEAPDADALFVLASISKPISVAVLMTLYDQGEFQLDDPAHKFLPEFSGGGRDRMTIRQLLTHISGLPDQLPENETLRKRQAGLSEFVAGAVRTPLLFEPGSRYEYSSMAILLATEIARRISKTELPDLFKTAIFDPLEMNRTALGLGPFPIESTMRCQVENAAPESGAGDPLAKTWDWNSPYWRAFGAPWGGVHGSAPDLARFFAEFLDPQGKALRPKTARWMIQNQNPEGLPPRGLGFAIGAAAGSPGCSEATFGHTGATGTLAWADPQTKTICVVLTTLPGRAADPHPRQLAADLVAQTVVSK
ncbi:hypothetical protein BH23PLA1_BH23PLA1_18350 [soil metagenome]